MFNVTEDTSFYEHSCLMLEAESEGIQVERLTVYNDELFVDEDQLYDELLEEIENATDELTDIQIKEAVKEKIKSYEFETVIVVRIGE